MLALSIRQPYAELILRGIKTVELRSKPTRIIGERFYIYACKAKAKIPVPIWSDDLRIGTPPQWMIELARQVRMIEPDEQGELPTGVIVGSAMIEAVTPAEGIFQWHLTQVRSLSRHRKPSRQPLPSWFRPF